MIENKELIINEVKEKSNAKIFYENYGRDAAELELIINKFIKRYKKFIVGWTIYGSPLFSSLVRPITHGDILNQAEIEVTNGNSFLEEKL
jgi:hypothetical protein